MKKPKQPKNQTPVVQLTEVTLAAVVGGGRYSNVTLKRGVIG